MSEVKITRDVLNAIAGAHHLPVPGTWPDGWRGATSRVIPCGEVVIKIPFDTAGAIQALLTDAAMNDVSRRLGVTTPPLIALDDDRRILPVPYAIYRRVLDAITLQEWSAMSASSEGAWFSLGREVALVHAVTRQSAMPLPLREFRQSPEVDPRPWVAELLAAGRLLPEDAAWLQRLLDRLAPAALADSGPGGDRLLRLCHGDVNAANVLVDQETGAFRAVIDWAGAGWLDPAWDFAGIPLDVVPAMLAGHRSVAPLPDDDTADARICWCQTQTRLYAGRNVHDVAAARRPGRLDLAGLRSFVAQSALLG